MDLRKSGKNVALSNLSIYYTWKYIKYNNKFKISAPVWKDKFKLPDESYSLYIFKIIYSTL